MNPRCLRAQIPACKRTKHYQKKKKRKPRTSGRGKPKMAWSVWEVICSAYKRPWRTRSCCPSSLSCIWPTLPSWNTRRPKLLPTFWWVTKRCARNCSRILSWNANHGSHQPHHREIKTRTPPKRCSRSSHSIWTPFPPWSTAQRSSQGQEVLKLSPTHFCRMSTMPWCPICRKACTRKDKKAAINSRDKRNRWTSHRGRKWSSILKTSALITRLSYARTTWRRAAVSSTGSAPMLTATLSWPPNRATSTRIIRLKCARSGTSIRQGTVLTVISASSCTKSTAWSP